MIFTIASLDRWWALWQRKISSDGPGGWKSNSEGRGKRKRERKVSGALECKLRAFLKKKKNRKSQRPFQIQEVPSSIDSWSLWQFRHVFRIPHASWNSHYRAVGGYPSMAIVRKQSFCFLSFFSFLLPPSFFFSFPLVWFPNTSKGSEKPNQGIVIDGRKMANVGKKPRLARQGNRWSSTNILRALHNGTTAAGLLGSIRVFPLVNLTPYRRHHEVAGAITVGDQRDRRLRYPNTRSIKVLLQTAVELL